jgi:nicotinamidase-related amidase
LRLPADGTLIVAGAQEAMSADRPHGVEANLALLVAAWRKEGLPVVHVRLDSAPAASFEARPTPLEGETVVDAGPAGAFVGSALEILLDDAGATTLVVCGALSAVEQTARDAGGLGYQVFVPFDACWPASPTGPVFDRLSRAGATVVDTALALGAAATAKARQRREAERKR